MTIDGVYKCRHGIPVHIVCSFCKEELETNTIQGKETAVKESDSYRVSVGIRYDLIPPIALARLAAIYTEGANKYGETAYIEKGILYSSIVNHAINHLNLYWRGDRSEDHIAKVAWAMFTIMTIDAEGLDGRYNDLTTYGKRIKKKTSDSN